MNIKRLITIGTLGTITALAGVIALDNYGQINTFDDSSMIPSVLERQTGKNVLGTGSEDEDPCPQNKPVIGWIDFTGNKIITESLPTGQQASACFENEQTANLEGYFKR